MIRHFSRHSSSLTRHRGKKRVEERKLSASNEWVGEAQQGKQQSDDLLELADVVSINVLVVDVVACWYGNRHNGG